MICYNLLVTCVYIALIGGSFSNEFIRFGDYEYYFGDGSQLGDYANAQQECVKRNATLVIIYTKEINQFIRRNVNGTGRSYFIGLQRTLGYNNNRGFLWNDGTSLTIFVWANGEPNNRLEKCAEISSWEQQYLLNDQSCTIKNRSFICQKKVQSCNISNPCGENSHCDDSTGYVRCPCNRGYEGDGFINCTDINECKRLKNFSFLISICSNTPGSFHIDVQSCNMSNPCGENSYCDDSNGYIRCPCNERYEGDGFINCTDIDECKRILNLTDPQDNCKDSAKICSPSVAVVVGILIGIVIVAGVIVWELYKKRQQESKSQQVQQPKSIDNDKELPDYVQANPTNIAELQNQQRLASNSTNNGKVDDQDTSNKIVVMPTDENEYLTPMKELPSYITLDDVSPVIMPTDENEYLTPMKELPIPSTEYYTIDDDVDSKKNVVIPTEKKQYLARKAADKPRYVSFVTTKT